jgi:hypothetical protein
LDKIKHAIIYIFATLGAIILGTLLAVGFMHSVLTLHKWSQSPNIDNYDDCELYIYSDLNPESESGYEIHIKQKEACKTLFPEEENN